MKFDLIEEKCKELKEEQLEFLKKLCSFPTGSRNIAGSDEVTKIISEFLINLGFETERIFADGYGYHIVAAKNKNSNEGKIVLHAHTDTVFSVEDYKNTQYKSDGKFTYGLGVADCKGGVNTILYSLKVLDELDLFSGKQIMVIFNCDEEIGSPTGQGIFKKYAEGADCVLSFEPGRKENGVLTERWGVAEGKIQIKGKSAHACGDSGYGINAAVEMANIILKLNDKYDEELGIHYNLSPIKAGEKPSVVADYAESEFWVTMKKEDSYNDIKNYILNELPNENIEKGSQITTDINLSFPPMERNEKNIRFYQKIKGLASGVGINLPEEFSKSPADCDFFSNMGIATLDGLGPYMYDIHTVNEHIITDSLNERTKLVSYLLSEI